MLAKQSEFLLSVKPKLKQLISILEKDFEYVSVLATDVTGESFVVSQRTKNISDYGDGEKGFVLRAYRDGGYMEYSFNVLEDVEQLAEKIRTELLAQEKLLDEMGVKRYETPVIHEEKMEKEFAGEVSEEMYDLNGQEILAKMKKLSDYVCTKANVLECQVMYSTELYRKMFLSSRKDLIQSWGVSFGGCFILALKDGETKYNMASGTAWTGTDLIDSLYGMVDKCYEDLMDMFGTPNIDPGEYTVICMPDATGLIAHEAFGHGVEMDMFVKNRAVAREHMGDKLASDITNMYDGAAGVENTASYFFDDEGVLAHKTQILDNGFLVSGICDALSASRLGVEPTGNGRRESFERKAYTRMTNTYFGEGSNTLDEMIASTDYGFLVDGMNSGMEDPKNWGIQCVLSRAREIKDGKLTGKMFTPVVLTGYVPDLLNNISMVGQGITLNGNGHCGKGHKEWVVVSDGGPIIKTKVRMG